MSTDGKITAGEGSADISRRPKIRVLRETNRFFISKRLDRLVRRAVLQTLNREYIYGDVPEICVIYTDNNGIRRLNREYRGIDSETDVLSFPYVEFKYGIITTSKYLAINHKTKRLYLGDVFLSVEQIAEQAAEYGNTFENEVCYMVVHSVLHLLGYDHTLGDEDEALMNEKHGKIMDILGIPR